MIFYLICLIHFQLFDLKFDALIWNDLLFDLFITQNLYMILEDL